MAGIVEIAMRPFWYVPSLVFTAVLLGGSLPVIADDLISKRFFQACIEQTPNRINGLESTRRSIAENIVRFSNPRNVRFGQGNNAIVSGDVNGKPHSRLETLNKETLKEYLDGQKARYAEVKALLQHEYITPFIDLNDMTVGEIGLPVQMSRPTSVEVQQVISDNRALISFGPAPFIYEGPELAGTVDGQRIDMTKISIVDKTETYETVLGGSRTVLVVRALTDDELREAVRYRNENWPKELSKFRTWTDASGTYSVDAAFVSCSRGRVTLKKSDGTELTLPLAKLSPEDRAYAKDRIDPW